MKRRILAAVAAMTLAVGLSACASENDNLSDLYREGNTQGFISSDGRVETIPAAKRGEALSFSGTGVDGSTVSSTDFAGDVLVLNFWYAACGPCRAEAPVLEQTFQDTKDDGAHFLGVNIYDGPEQATSFDETYKITYPSILARGDVDLKLAFADWTSLQAAPTTLIVDRKGRVAARLFGQLPDATTLRDLVDDALAEKG
ncbi:Thiol-disulfide oxidoreductase ResA [Microbacterium oleivorans]|uniref:Putative thiol-disulfide isomerase n=1 Tax=Microbacterium oleivorans TaxID=273677 RepID=A0A031FU62_9MICO|nr:TlpA disulfide reductase family protein [Microbacterium oleivorans]AZS43034.1 Thiol-disulfide oxidoreductase ResA [Microbacterium oleivorans]EZP28128.1 putative thiol-disulfide isomerase [Microbacterium oleivorans]